MSFGSLPRSAISSKTNGRQRQIHRVTSSGDDGDVMEEEEDGEEAEEDGEVATDLETEEREEWLDTTHSSCCC